eukprot:897219-Rhodomonas_salina.3
MKQKTPHTMSFLVSHSLVPLHMLPPRMPHHSRSSLLAQNLALYLSPNLKFHVQMRSHLATIFFVQSLRGKREKRQGRFRGIVERACLQIRLNHRPSDKWFVAEKGVDGRRSRERKVGENRQGLTKTSRRRDTSVQHGWLAKF